MTELTVFPKNNSPIKVEKLIKNLKEDYKKIKHLFCKIIGYDSAIYNEMKKELGELGIMGTYITPPGLHIFAEYFEGSLETATYAYFDYPKLFEELCNMYEEYKLKKLGIYLELGIDSILTGENGSITLQLDL